MMAAVLFVSAINAVHANSEHVKAGQAKEGQTLNEQTAAKQQVIDFVTAFNKQDVGAMLGLASENVAWMSVAGKTVGIEAEGAENLKAAMQDYFSSHPDSRSKIKQIQSSGPWIMTLEQAGRESDGEFKGQCAYAMYQLRDGVIESVWYFDAHSCDP